MCSAEAVSSEGSQLIKSRGLLLVKHKTIEAHWVLHVGSLCQRRCNCSIGMGSSTCRRLPQVSAALHIWPASALSSECLFYTCRSLAAYRQPGRSHDHIVIIIFMKDPPSADIKLTEGRTGEPMSVAGS